jgi:hypothetical protein
MSGLPPGLQGMFGGGAPQAYAAFVKGAERQTGLIDILRKDDDVYFDLNEDQLERPFLIAPALAGGVGGNAFAGRIYPTFVLEFQKVGKRILWISKNPRFTAPPGTSFANALAVSTSDSVIASTPIVAQDEAKKRIVISAAFFLSDYESLGRDLGGGEGGGGLVLLLGPARPTYALDPTRSYVEKTKALPKNDEILTNLVFAGPAAGPGGATDGRGVRLRMHWSIVEAPAASNYVPRFADDRVGYFMTTLKNFSDDSSASPVLRYIDRWNFNNGPVVYYLTNEIPSEYKPAIRRALLRWNDAFAKVGIPNAVEVRDQPSDPAWDPDDIRYSTVRWLTSDQPAFSAYGPNISDPRTGEVLRVEVVIDGEAVRSVKRGYIEQVAPTRHAAASEANLDARSALIADLTGKLPGDDAANALCADPEDCDDFMQESADYASLGTLQQMAGGASPAQVQRYTEDWLYSVVLHESGHNFGLRHNFAAPIYPLAKLHDRAFTERNGLVNSVMNYTPVNLSPPGRPQGDYFQMRLGPYDYWAIRYGYQRYPNVKQPADERAALQRVAEESTRPEYVFATDEDSAGLRGIDPRVAPFQLSSDRFEFYRNQFDVVDDLVGRLDRVFPRDDRSFYEERLAFLGMERQYQRAALLAVKYVGGLYTSRSHRGQPGAVAPIRPVTRDDQRRAFTELAQHVFSSRAMRLPPELLSNLGPSNFVERGSTELSLKPDFPVTDYVTSVQDTVLFSVFAPDVLGRIVDQQLRDARPGASMSEADLFGWMQAAVWTDASLRANSIDLLQRSLQRRWTNYLIALSLAPSFVVEAVGFPSDTAPLARYELRRLDERLAGAMRRQGLDVATRAHLEDMYDRVHHALDPNATRGA